MNDPMKVNKSNWPTAVFTANPVEASRYGGWSYAGITQFNELLSNVIPARRKATKKLEEQLKEMYVAALKDKPEKARKAKLDSSEVVISLMEETDDGTSDEERSSDEE